MSTNPVRVVATFVCKPEGRAALLNYLPALIEKVRQEEGCIEYDCYQDTQNPLRYTFIETWASEEALKAHSNGAALKWWAEVAGPLREPDVDVRILKAI